jgi:hypothetical protein
MRLLFKNAVRPYLGSCTVDANINVGTSPRPISIGQLHAFLHFHIRPITQ